MLALHMAAVAAAAELAATNIRWELVISHFDEKLDWLPRLLEETALSKDRSASIVFYHKGGGKVRLENPIEAAAAYMEDASNAQYLRSFNGSLAWYTARNVGREQETFVRHLSRGYNHLAPLTAFVQGNPNHSGNVLEDLKQAEGETYSQDFQDATTASYVFHAIRTRLVPTPRSIASDRCGLLGSPRVPSLADGCHNHCGLAVAATCALLRRAGGSGSRLSCREPFRFTNGGMFYTSRDAVWAHDRSLYRLMLGMLTGEARHTRRAPLYPYIYERLCIVGQYPQLFQLDFARLGTSSLPPSRKIRVRTPASAISTKNHRKFTSARGAEPRVTQQP